MGYKLYYFDIRGYAEPARLIIAYGNLKCEQVRIPFNSHPTPLPVEIKEQCNWGQVPMLVVDGKKLFQSLAITRFLAKKVGLVGSNDFESAQCDEYVDATRELMDVSWPLYEETDPNKMPKLIEVFTKKAQEKYLGRFESILQENGSGWLVGKSMTWADIYLYDAIDNIKIAFGADILTKEHVMLKQLMKNVSETPGIKEWVQTRPVTYL